MTFHAFGFNHQTAPVSVREACALTEAACAEVYAVLDRDVSAEFILLSTCNRTEVYLFGTDADVEVVRQLLCRRAGCEWPSAQAFHRQDEAAVLHVLRVTAGVASQVTGDAQILAQVKQAYRNAVDAGRVGTVLHRLMHAAFRAAKRVRSETTLADGAASVSSLAVQSARAHFECTTGEGLARRPVLLVGLGHMGLAALRSLKNIGVGEILLTNRSHDRAQELAEEFDATVVPWMDRHTAAGSADVVIVASAAPEPILYADRLPERAGAPALVIDVAVPRNVEPAVAETPGYVLIDIDSLNEWRDAAVSSRRAALPAAETICQETLREFVGWILHHEALQPALHALRDTFEAIRLQAIEQHACRFRDCDRDDLDHLTRSILQKLLAVPIVRLKSTDPGSIDFARGVQFLSHVFSRPGCEEDPAGSPVHPVQEFELPEESIPRPDVIIAADAPRNARQ
jgi:glutamyl-tRNA reductase